MRNSQGTLEGKRKSRKQWENIPNELGLINFTTGSAMGFKKTNTA